jgi:hypothetical protein
MKETRVQTKARSSRAKEMCKKARDCVVMALNNAQKEYIFWPDAEKRREIAQRIESNYHLPNCPMMMDGMLLHLSLTPESQDASDYHGRKFLHSLTVNVLNDDRMKIRAYLAGFPVSAHDNCVWKIMK